MRTLQAIDAAVLTPAFASEAATRLCGQDSHRSKAVFATASVHYPHLDWTSLR